MSVEPNQGLNPNANQERARVYNAPEINKKIDEEMEKNISHYAALGDTALAERIDELEREWDAERVLQIQTAALSLTGLVLSSLTRNRRWLVMPALALPFAIHHALQGWSPPFALLRMLGVRTRSEIDRERYALKALRGDFNDVAARETAVTLTDRARLAVNAAKA